jgi:putative ABC transport system permease protein
MHGTGGTVDASLRSLGRTSTGTLAVRQLRRALVAAQFAIATPLLIVAGLLLASLNELKRVDLGFDTRNVVTASVRLAPGLYPQPGSVVSFWDELRRRIEALPGVEALAYADGRPPQDVGNFNNFDLEEHPAGPGQPQPVTPWVAVTPEYFRVLGLRLIDGRLFNEQDGETEDSRPVVVVDRAWQRRFFPNKSAVGKRFRSGGCTTCPWTTVVGVVSEVKYAGLEQPDQGTVYTAYTGRTFRYLVVRAGANASMLIPSIRQTVRELDPNAPFSQVATIDELVAQSIERPQSLSILVGSFAGVALLLSIVGIYGVMGYYVQQNLKDISIRIALGGSSMDVLRLVVGHGMTVVAAGVAAGLLASLGLTRLVQSLLFQVSAANPLTFAAVSLGLVLVALLACLLPARRAIGLQPASVLRME